MTIRRQPELYYFRSGIDLQHWRARGNFLKCGRCSPSEKRPGGAGVLTGNFSQTI